MTPVIQPGTIEAYQKAIDLDPNGPIGAQAKQGLESLQAMGVGITTKVGEAPTANERQEVTLDFSDASSGRQSRPEDA